MKAKLIVEGKEFNIEINDPELVKLVKPPKKTGYERAEIGNKFYYIADDCIRRSAMDERGTFSNMSYDGANYYSDESVAENNARADKLMRQLRRFAVEHREKEIDWSDINQEKWQLVYNHDGREMIVKYHTYLQSQGAIYFDTKASAKLAIETFHDELIWYFTEYKDSL